MIRAEVDLSFFRRFLWIAIGCVLGTAWCLLDAWVTYPRKLVIAESYESFPQTDAGLEQWQAVSEKNGWLAEPPEKTASELRALMHEFETDVAIAVDCEKTFGEYAIHNYR